MGNAVIYLFFLKPNDKVSKSNETKEDNILFVTYINKYNRWEVS